MIFLKVYAVRQASHVMVGLDDCGFSAKPAFYHIRVDVPCTRKSTAPIFLASSSNTRMNSSPMIFTFCLRLGDSCQFLVETLLGIDTDEVQVIIRLLVRIRPLPRLLHFYGEARDLRIRRSPGLPPLWTAGPLPRISSTPPDRAHNTLPLPIFSRSA